MDKKITVFVFIAALIVAALILLLIKHQTNTPTLITPLNDYPTVNQSLPENQSDATSSDLFPTQPHEVKG